MDRERKFDPVTPAIKDDIKPGFLGGKGSSDDAPRRDSSTNDLKSFEKNAEDTNTTQDDGGLESARESEEEAGGLYTGDGKSGTVKKRSKGKASGRGPIITILLLVFGFGGFASTAQLFQPFSLVAQLRETFNSMHTSTAVRSGVFFRMQMDSSRVKDPIRGSVFGSKTFKITDSQKTRLAAQGIEYDDNYKGNRVLKFSDEFGNVKIITADAGTAGKLGDGAVDFRSYYNNNNEFFNRYNAGSATWRGEAANWFNSLTMKFLANNKLSRNVFDDFRSKVDENGGNPKAVTQDIIMKRTDSVDGGGYSTKRKAAEEVDENGESVLRELDDVSGVDPNNPKVSDTEAEVDEKFEGMSRSSLTSDSDSYINVRTKLDSIAGGVQKGANIACTVGNVIGAVTLLVTASEALQIINLTTAFFETVDKTRVGLGDDAPIHVMADALNEKFEEEIETLEYASGSGYSEDNDSSSNITNDGIKALTTKKQKVEKTAMQSAGIAALYGGGPVNSKDPSVASFNFSSNIKRILGGIGVSMNGFKTCAIAKIATNAVSAVKDVVNFGKCLAGVLGAAFTAGLSIAGGCAGLAIGIARSIALSVAIGVTISAVISTITPIVASSLTRDIVSNLAGESFGNALTSGGNMYQGNTHRANGGSLTTIDKYKQFAIARQQVIAENAKYERATLSPFDLTSKNTFMGSILTKFMSLLTVTSIMDTIVSSNSLVSSSVASIFPTAMAYDIEQELPNSIEEYEETCPYLASIGAIGDAFCNPYSATDTDTISDDPVDVISKLDEWESFQNDDSNDGNVQIDGESDLAKYILFCDNRESAFGIADQNIVNSVTNWAEVRTDNSTINAAANAAIGAIPVLGDVIDVVNNKNALDNAGYVGGESCVAGNELGSAFSESPSWDKAKYYQRFIEDQALAETMGLFGENGKSAVTAFLDDYYEKNPLDNSYEGILARKSGMTKETVVALLDIIDYGNKIADYHPEERYAFGKPVVEEDDEIKFNNENVLAGGFVLLNQISFSDVRNRSFAA